MFALFSNSEIFLRRMNCNTTNSTFVFGEENLNFFCDQIEDLICHACRIDHMLVVQHTHIEFFVRVKAKTFTFPTKKKKYVINLTEIFTFFNEKDQYFYKFSKNKYSQFILELSSSSRYLTIRDFRFYMTFFVEEIFSDSGHLFFNMLLFYLISLMFFVIFLRLFNNRCVS